MYSNMIVSNNWFNKTPTAIIDHFAFLLPEEDFSNFPTKKWISNFKTSYLRKARANSKEKMRRVGVY